MKVESRRNVRIATTRWLFVLLAASFNWAAAAHRGDLVLEAGSWEDREADFGTLTVREDRQNEQSKLIEIPVVRMRSDSEDPADPVFVCHGGPGMPNIREYPYDGLLENHDVVMVGYRGAEGSVVLEAPEIKEALLSCSDPLVPESLKKLGEGLTKAYRRFEREGIDVTQYNVAQIAEDIEQARKGLGYKKINITAGSFGTAVSYIYCVRYPQNVHRNVMVAPTKAWNIAVGDPQDVDATLEHINSLWKADPYGLSRSKDIAMTIRHVLTTLPREQNGMRIEPGPVKLGLYLFGYSRTTLAQVLDAFVAAENGDYSSLAFMAAAWGAGMDQIILRDLYAKTYSTHVGELRDYEPETDTPDSIIGAPLARLAWGPAKYTKWPVTSASEKYMPPRNIKVETLFVCGTLDTGTESVNETLMPLFESAKIVYLKDFGHNDVTTTQQEAATHLQKTFFLKGIVDDSRYTFEPVNFKPAVTLQEMAAQMMNSKGDSK
jgi:pimeloyl-ACP methyl ester carboxylesterase